MYAFLAHIVGYDLWFYLSHRLLHTHTLWWIHKEHHAYIYPKWYDTYSGHWLEGPFQSLGYGSPLLIGVWSPWEALAALIVINLRGMGRHDPRSAWLIDGGHHLQHHQQFTKNYGEPWLDWVCGTRAPSGLRATRSLAASQDH